VFLPAQVVNNLDGVYEEGDGKAFVYNSDYDLCPEQTLKNW
jgi:hypothetical protein